MKILFAKQFLPILAQAGGLAQGASKAMGAVLSWGGGFAIRRGDTDSGKLSIIGRLIIAGARVIVKALFHCLRRRQFDG